MRVRRKTSAGAPGKLMLKDLAVGDLFSEDNEDNPDDVYMLLDESDGDGDMQATNMLGVILRFKPDEPVRRRAGELVLDDD